MYISQQGYRLFTSIAGAYILWIGASIMSIIELFLILLQLLLWMCCSGVEIPDVPSAKHYDDNGPSDEPNQLGSSIVPPIYVRDNDDDDEHAAALPPRIASANSNAIPPYIHGPDDDDHLYSNAPVYIHGPDDDQQANVAKTNDMTPIYINGKGDSVSAKCVASFNNSLNK